MEPANTQAVPAQILTRRRLSADAATSTRTPAAGAALFASGMVASRGGLRRLGELLGRETQ